MEMLHFVSICNVFVQNLVVYVGNCHFVLVYILFISELNVLKTADMFGNFWENAAPPIPITLCDSPVNTVKSLCFPGTIVSQDFEWEQKVNSLTKKAKQMMYFL